MHFLVNVGGGTLRVSRELGVHCLIFTAWSKCSKNFCRYCLLHVHNGSMELFFDMKIDPPIGRRILGPEVIGVLAWGWPVGAMFRANLVRPRIFVHDVLAETTVTALTGSTKERLGKNRVRLSN